MLDVADGPTVSVLIPCYSRPDDLRHCIEQLSKQSFKDLEIVVVDDGSPGDDVRDCARAYPQVHYIRSDANVGLIAARNLGTEHCHGRYLLNLDDDSWLVSPEAISRAVAVMEASPDIGVLAFNVVLKGSGPEWRGSCAPFDTSHYIGCGNMYRRAVIDRIGPYVAAFRRQGEEVERSMRVWDAGFRVVAQPELLVFHDEAPVNRNVQANHALDAINYLRRELMRAPLVMLPYAILRATLFTIRTWHDLDRRLFWSEFRGQRGPGITTFLGGRFRRAVSLGAYLHFHRLVVQERRRGVRHAVP